MLMANVMLPKQIDPIQLADNQKTLKGELQLVDMARLMELVCDKHSGVAKIEFNFGRDQVGYAFMHGSIKTGFKVICQRCNKPMSLDLNIGIELSPVRTDQEAEQLPKNYDPLLITGDTISLLTMVEEEILLSIPIVPKHSIKECNVKTSELIEYEEEKDKSHPFENLKKLLRE